MINYKQLFQVHGACSVGNSAIENVCMIINYLDHKA